MNLESHIKSTGGIGKEIHEFLDQFFGVYRIDHRVVLHHKIGIKLVGEKFGTNAILIAEKHIRDDWNGEIPEGPDDSSFYREAWACDLRMFREAYRKAKQIEMGKLQLKKYAYPVDTSLLKCYPTPILKNKRLSNHERREKRKKWRARRRERYRIWRIGRHV